MHRSAAYKPVLPATAIASQRVLPDKVAEYCKAQATLTDSDPPDPASLGWQSEDPLAQGRSGRYRLLWSIVRKVSKVGRASSGKCRGRVRMMVVSRIKYDTASGTTNIRSIDNAE